jgi:hypothetical protein
MNDSDKALEHLKVIRGLMEKATVYRAVSVPTAIIGGLLAIAAASTFYLLNDQLDTAMTVTIWLSIAVLVNAIHHGLIWRTAQKEAEPYLSSGLRMALKALLPPMFVGGVLSLALAYGPQADLVATTLVWITFYGLALMATSGFSPRSLRVLGLAFTLVGSFLLGLHWADAANILGSISPQRTAAILMGLTFGLFHLVYAVYTRSQQRGSATED